MTDTSPTTRDDDPDTQVLDVDEYANTDQEDIGTDEDADGEPIDVDGLDESGLDALLDEVDISGIVVITEDDDGEK